MGMLKTFTKSLIAGNATVIAAAQAVAGAGNLTLASATVTLDSARQVLITSAGNDSGITFTVYGTNEGGNAIQETVTGANASTVATGQSFLTVTRVAASAAAAGNVSVGTNTVGASAWDVLNVHSPNFEVGFSAIVTGTINYTVQHTYDDPNGLAVGAYPTPFNNAAASAQTASIDGAYTTPVMAIRIQINSGTGSVKFSRVQTDISGA